MKKLLFTPGPLSTSQSVKAVMMQDQGSRDYAFTNAVKEIRSKLLELGHVSKEAGYETVIMQGSGTFSIESVISSSVGKDSVLLLLVNGAYGERMVKMAAIHSLNYLVIRFNEDVMISPEVTENFLADHPEITHLACVHSETTTGLFNPIEQIGLVCKKRQLIFIVDAMSSFGGVEMDLNRIQADFLISSSNKCIEGVPGFGFVLCRRAALEKCKGQARSLSLDLFDQWKGLESNGQFRFTPPTLSLMAFRQAISELEQEGGITAREKRYRSNKAVLDEGMNSLGFKQYLDPLIQGHIITSFLYPESKNFDFDRMYNKLSERGLVIYPGKLSQARAFRIGTIGQLFPEDFRTLISAIREILEEEEITLQIN